MGPLLKNEHNNQYFFLHTAHCSEGIGFVHGTPDYQPAPATGRLVGIEVADPPPFYYFDYGACVYAEGCRWSDAALSSFFVTDHYWGSIAHPWPGTLQINGHFTIDDLRWSRGNAGFVVHKVGASTGLTQGVVVTTCADVKHAVSNIWFLCQHLADLHATGGDSGAPILDGVDFPGDRSIRLVGMLIGRGEQTGLAVFTWWAQWGSHSGYVAADPVASSHEYRYCLNAPC